ncbi:radical SAM protein [Effusibacillus dendaii]|uniref:7-carboxy-7-deazaguanine synthase n=1 Tax=Effusibacillus dendaii TaxID=2743772 RepID=A0A7I8D8U7_9BACL|nr:radical SAM protein [Effusibacillus dendaii]BCJ86568.1 7-carboxy-7-deazaguanine synthase [Effusibacillus dendaii]
MKVNEIFFSIQGESASIGLPTIFVRFTGCNLRCTYCDTKYSYYEGESDTPEGILEKIRSYGIKRVCLTGGEPLIQPRTEMQRLLDLLAAENYEVSIETDGSIDISKFQLRGRQRFILDMKVPSSAMSNRMDFENLKRIVPERDEVKFVVGNREDYEWARNLMQQYELQPEKGYQLIFSPIFGDITYQELVSWLLEDRIDVRFQVQLHKIVWDPDLRGV